MGMSTRVVGFKPPDEKWEQMRAVWQACTDAGVEIPREVERFFEDEAPDPRGVEISSGDLRKAGALSDWQDGPHAQGFEVDVRKLPADVTVIRFYNSW